MYEYVLDEQTRPFRRGSACWQLRGILETDRVDQGRNLWKIPPYIYVDSLKRPGDWPPCPASI